MRIARFAQVCVLLGLGAIVLPAGAGDDRIVFGDCRGLQLDLEGAPHHYWVAPEQGRVVLVRQCVPAEADCDHDVITVWDREGRKIFEAAPFLEIPEMPPGPIRDAVLRTPNRLVVSAAVANVGDFRPVLAEYDIGTGELVRVAPTGSVECLDLAADGEGITWCLGEDPARRSAGEDYDLVYRFDEVGVLQSSTLPRSTFPSKAHPLAGTWRGNFRGGFLRGVGPLRLWLPDVGELIAFDDEGHVSDRLVLPTVAGQRRAHLVSGPDGEVYAMIITGDDREPDEWTQALYRLADDGSAWLPLAGLDSAIPMQIALVGADEEGLVLYDRRSLVLCRLPVVDEARSQE
jgi:hypothetical protein